MNIATKALIAAARDRATTLLIAATGDASEHGARTTESEAQRWQALANAAQAEIDGAA